MTDRDVWLLDGDEEAVRASEQAGPGDYVVRRAGDTVQAGRITDAEGNLRWFGDVDPTLLPDVDQLEAAEDRRGPLQRVRDAADLRQAIEGIETAERTRGG